MSNNIFCLSRCLYGLRGTIVSKASRSAGSFMLLDFGADLEKSTSGTLSRNSILVEFSEWNLYVACFGAINQDSGVKIIDRGLSQIVGMRVFSVKFGPGVKLGITLEGASLSLLPATDSLPDDQAWIFYNDQEEGATEAWTVMCDNSISYWKGRR